MPSETLATPRFFVLRDALFSAHDTKAAPAKPQNVGDAPRCANCGRTLGMLTWLPPFRAVLSMHGQTLGDFVATAGDDALLSERFAEAIRAEGLTGFLGFEPVEVVDVLPKARRPLVAPRYVHVTACFGSAAVDVAHSRLRRREPVTCDVCRQAGSDGIYGFSIEPGTWGGEDVFRPRGSTADLVVSERFARLVERHGFTNMTLIPTEEFVWDPYQLGPP